MGAPSALSLPSRSDLPNFDNRSTIDRKDLDRVDSQAIRGISMTRVVVLGFCAAVFLVQASWSKGKHEPHCNQ